MVQEKGIQETTGSISKKKKISFLLTGGEVVHFKLVRPCVENRHHGWTETAVHTGSSSTRNIATAPVPCYTITAASSSSSDTAPWHSSASSRTTAGVWLWGRAGMAAKLGKGTSSPSSSSTYVKPTEPTPSLWSSAPSAATERESTPHLSDLHPGRRVFWAGSRDTSSI